MKNIVPILIVIALLVGGFAYMTLFGHRDNSSSQTEETVATTETATSTKAPELPLSGVGTLSSLQARGVSLECQITYDSADYEYDTEGTYFVADGKVRGDFVIPAPELGGEVVSSLIVDQTNLYYWSVIDGESFGFMSSKSANANPQAVKKQEPIPSDENVRYVCKPWTVIDGSIFVPPATVTFQDLNALMEAGMEYGN